MRVVEPNPVTHNVTLINGGADKTSAGENAGASENAAKETKTIAICETQPVTGEGLRALLASCPDLKVVESSDSLNRAMDLAWEAQPDVLLIDKAFGIQAI